jgi:hypothetical protein
VTDPRQPAYDAVFAYIRQQPRDFLPVTVVGRNAMIWRAVHAALDAMGVPGLEGEPAPAATEATERPTLRERHRAQWLALTDAEQTARIAALDEDDEPEQPERTTPDNSPTSSDEADNLTGAWTPDPPIGCLTVATEPTPSQRPGLRTDIARAIHRYDRERALSRNDLPSKHHRGEADAVLTLLYREWPWLRAEAEDAIPPA